MLPHRVATYCGSHRIRGNLPTAPFALGYPLVLEPEPEPPEPIMLTIIRSTLADASDFVVGSLPILAGLAGILALVVLPLWWIARSLGVN